LEFIADPTKTASSRPTLEVRLLDSDSALASELSCARRATTEALAPMLGPWELDAVGGWELALCRRKKGIFLFYSPDMRP
jgi:hypothetical protein